MLLDISVFLAGHEQHRLLQNGVALSQRNTELLRLRAIEAVSYNSRIHQLVPNANENVVIARVPSACPTNDRNLM